MWKIVSQGMVRVQGAPVPESSAATPAKCETNKYRCQSVQSERWGSDSGNSRGSTHRIYTDCNVKDKIAFQPLHDQTRQKKHWCTAATLIVICEDGTVGNCVRYL